MSYAERSTKNLKELIMKRTILVMVSMLMLNGCVNTQPKIAICEEVILLDNGNTTCVKEEL